MDSDRQKDIDKRKNIDIEVKIEIIGDDEKPPKTLGKRVSDFCMNASMVFMVAGIVVYGFGLEDLSVDLIILYGVFLGVSLLCHNRLDDLRYRKR